MPSRSRRFGAPDGGEPQDTRPVGTFFYADPSAAIFSQMIHRENCIPDDKAEKVPAHVQMLDYESGAIRSVDRRTLRMHDPQWVKKHPEGKD